MDFIPGESWRRPDRVLACAARTCDIREAERDLLLHALVAVQLDARVQLTCDGVHQEALHQLRIPSRALQVTRISTSTFLLRFLSPELRNSTYARRSLVAGRTSLHLMPWGRQVSAAAACGHLFYRARICLEGVPGHAHQIETVLHLLPKQSFVEGIDYVREREDEKGCFILWIWCQDPDALAVLGTLQIEEPVAPPNEYPIDSDDAPLLRSKEVSTLKYEVLIHLDRVEDYNPSPRTPSRGSFESDISGLPNDEPMVEWPLRHKFVWHLGQPDALPEPPRASVHSRLGGRRDRSPPRDGGAGGGAGGFRQVPPPNQHDMARSIFGAPGSSRNAAGGGYQGHYRGFGLGAESELQATLLVNANHSQVQLKMDPMIEEAMRPANLWHSQPTVSQCSVEPTVVQRAPAVPDLLVWEKDLVLEADQQLEASRQQFIQVDAPELISTAQLCEDNASGLHSRQDNVLDLLTCSGSAEPMFGKMFDLNEEWETQRRMFDDNSVGADREGNDGRDILAPADERLNKQGKELPSHKTGPKGMARLAIPLKKSLLCTPAHKPKTQHYKKSATATEMMAGRRDKQVNKIAAGSIDNRATALLMKTSGILGDNELPSEAALNQLGTQFVLPMKEDLLGDMRTAFGMPESGADALGALLADADDHDD
ncbi:unnamed protein product [Urochloa decumbens]|uniref:Uncharacterized protein n=1 Tax=Urochloa decumbens TaxID=240449 RepID=A0ABC9CT29_9POAL